jgi:hypothetical protein
VLVGSSLSSADEPALFRIIGSLGSVLGTLPATVLKKAAASMVGQVKISSDRQAELKADFARNDPRVMRQGLRAYLRWLHRDDDPARRLCDAGNRGVSRHRGPHHRGTRTCAVARLAGAGIVGYRERR